MEWEWISKETIFDDEVGKKDLYLTRTKKDMDAIYAEKEITTGLVKDFLMDRIKHDDHFARRCLALMNSDKLLQQDLISLYRDLGIKPV